VIVSPSSVLLFAQLLRELVLGRELFSLRNDHLVLLVRPFVNGKYPNGPIEQPP
jgi:hypothetical protein